MTLGNLMQRLLTRRVWFSLPARIWLLGAALSVLAAMGLQREQEQVAERRIEEEAASFEAALGSSVEAYLALLRGGIALLATMPEVTREDFRQYVERVGLKENYRGVLGIGFSLRVDRDEVADVEARAREEGVPSFRIWPESAREEYHTIYFIEPQHARNRAALGYDMSTEPVRRSAMERARRTGEAAATGPVTLVQEIEAEKQQGFLVYAPFYGSGRWPRTEAERVERLQGYVYAPFRAADLFVSVKQRVGLDADMRLAVYHGLERVESAQFYESAPSNEAGGKVSITQVRTVRIVDQTWTLVYSAAPTGLISPWLLFLMGLTASTGVSLLLRRESLERRRAEQSEAVTREREGELTLLIEAVPAVVSFIDRNGVFRLSNRRYEEWFGLDPRTMLGRPLADVVGAKSYAEIEPHVQRALRGESVAFERWHHFGRAGVRYLSTYFVPHRSRTGELNGFYSLISDLTSLKRAEESARFIADCGKLLISSLDYESTARGIVHLAVPAVSDIAILWRVNQAGLVAAAVSHAEDTVERRLTDALRTVTVSLGGSHNIALAARSGMVVVTQDVSNSDLERLSDDMNHRELIRELGVRSALHIPIVVRRKIWAVFSFGTSALSGRQFTDQHRSLADEIATRVRLAAENALLHQEAQKEIEERRRAERISQETEERFRLLVAGARDYAIILLDPDAAVASWNEGAERILGFGEQEAVGLPISRLYTEEDQGHGAPHDELARARETGSALEERWYVRKDGTRFWASGHTVVLRNADGLIRGYAKIMRDLTEWKLTEEELESRVQQRTLELNEAVQELEAFSYSVSHDLRAPLRSIRGFTELTLEEAADRLHEGEKDYLLRVQRAVTRLDQLISDLLAYTRVSKTRVEIHPVDLQALVSDLRREHPEFQAPWAEIVIEESLSPVMGNVAYLTQCVTNLLSNAVKFVKPGQVPHVRIWTEQRKGKVGLWIRDNGIGIPAESLGRVFDMFERLHVGNGYEGTGVGLAIVRRAVQRMNGTITVESTEGDGTTFCIELAAVGDDDV